MATVKVSALTAKTTPAGTEELLINDGGTSKKITIANAVKATDLPTAPAGIDTDTSKEYNLKLTDSGGTETLTWIEESDDDTTYSTATSSTEGLVKIEDDTAQTTAAESVTTAASRTYGIQLNASDQAVVNVPWTDTDTNTTYTSSDFTHDSLSGVTANEHIDWTGSSAGTIHSSNYTDTDTVYTHPSSDGNLHVPATSTTNNGKLLTAGATAGAISWEDAPVSLPTQTGNADKQLTTNGSSASWTATNTTTKGLYEHEHTIDADYSITSGNNAISASPITISSGKSVTVPTGSTWVIV